MKTKLIALALAAGLALPAAAHANTTTRAELQRDRAAVHHEKRQLARAVHNGNYQQAKVEHRQLSAARHELRQDKRALAKQQHRRWHRNHPG